MKLTITQPDYSSPEWSDVPADQRSMIRLKLKAIEAAPSTGIVKWFAEQAPRFDMQPGGWKAQYYAYRETGDWKVLADKRSAKLAPAEEATTRTPRFLCYLEGLVNSYQRKSLPAFRELRRRWRVRDQQIPGYEGWPGWPAIPAGWSNRNLADIIKAESDKARRQSIRVGTSSKTNPFLPQVYTTRVGLEPGMVIQLDDMRHNFHVTLGKKRELVLVNELGALDLSSAHRFHWGAKPRRKRDDGTREDLAAKDMRSFLAGMFHRCGHSPFGCMLMSEHQTAKVDEDIARLLYDATRGMIRVDYQPIEGKQAALSGYWPGTEGGNFRAKACLESTHALMQNDLSALALQTGSFSSGLKGPVTTDRIVAYIAKILLDVAKHVPHRLDLLRLPAVDFHAQLLPFLTDYYHFGLAMRTEHELEGWPLMNRVVTEYTALPDSGSYFSEERFLKLPEVSQLAIREAARQAPKEWTRRRNLSPLEAFNKRAPWQPLPATVICDMIGKDMAREVKAHRGFIEFSDEEISLVPLVYKARYESGPRRGQEIGHGEKVNMFIFPFDDTATAIAVDAQGRFLGELPLYKRILSIDPAAFGSTAPYDSRPDIRSEELRDAAGDKHSRIADILEPARIQNAERVQEASDLREHNRRIADPRHPVSPEEIAAHHHAAGQKATATKRANRVAQVAAGLDTDQALEAWSDTADAQPPARTQDPDAFDPFS